MDKILRFIPNHSHRQEENEFIVRNQCSLVLVFSGLWFLYCWWLSERCHLDFGQFTTILRWLFCLMHVLTVWRFFLYLSKLAFRFYQFTRRVGIILVDYFSLIVLTFVLFLLLTFVLNFKKVLQESFAIVD